MKFLKMFPNITNNFTTENLFQWVVDTYVSLLFPNNNPIKHLFIISRKNPMLVGSFRKIVIILVVRPLINQQYSML